jgi:hypothetical protein
VGSSPISHPKYLKELLLELFCFLTDYLDAAKSNSSIIIALSTNF